MPPAPILAMGEGEMTASGEKTESESDSVPDTATDTGVGFYAMCPAGVSASRVVNIRGSFWPTPPLDVEKQQRRARTHLHLGLRC